MTSTRPSVRLRTSGQRHRRVMSGAAVARLLVDTDVCIDHLAGDRRLLAGMDEIPINRRVADRAGLLRRRIPALRMPDALIAATALVHSLALLTNNRRDFQRVADLRLR